MFSRSCPRFLVTAMILISVAGCAGASTGSGSGSKYADRVDQNVISAEEIRTAAAANALDLVTGLRPRWLNKRGPQSVSAEGDIIVYMASARMGGLQSLRDIPASTLDRLEYLDATKANFRFGRGHPYGAIVVHVAGGAIR